MGILNSFGIADFYDDTRLWDNNIDVALAHRIRSNISRDIFGKDLMVKPVVLQPRITPIGRQPFRSNIGAGPITQKGGEIAVRNIATTGYNFKTGALVTPYGRGYSIGTEQRKSLDGTTTIVPMKFGTGSPLYTQKPIQHPYQQLAHIKELERAKIITPTGAARAKVMGIRSMYGTFPTLTRSGAYVIGD